MLSDKDRKVLAQVQKDTELHTAKRRRRAINETQKGLEEF